MSLSDLSFNESNVDMYTTPYINCTDYKNLRIICKFSNSGYLYVSHSNNPKDGDSLTSTYLVQGNKSSLHKVEICCDYVRLCVQSMNQGSELIENIDVQTRGRRAVSSTLIDLIQKFQPAQTVQEVQKERELVIEPEQNQEDVSRQQSNERMSGLYKRLGIHQKKKDDGKRNSISNASCKVPSLILKGHLLYCRDNGKLECLPPPVADNRNYLLCMNNKTPFWMAVEDFQENGQGWFKN